MSWETRSGTTLAISAGTPATFDATGYAALTWTTVGEVTDPGGGGKTFQTVTHMAIARRFEQKAKGMGSYGARTIEMAVDRDDAGQDLIDAALSADADYSFRYTSQSGTVEYCRGQITAAPYNGGDGNTVWSRTVTLEVNTDSVFVDPV